MKNIWQFSYNEKKETDNIDLSKTFKPVGRFYEDVETLTKLLDIKIHPALKPVHYGSSGIEENKEEEEKKIA
jgi:hypothetical protein